MQRTKLIKIGIFVVVISFLTVWGYSFLKNKNFFSSNNIFYAVYDDIKGLTLSGTIYVNGYKVGNVIGLYFKEDNSGQIIAEFSIDNEIKIPKGSIAEISSLDIMGTRGVRIMRNMESNEYLESGDTLLSEIEADLSEQVNTQILPLKMKTEEMISSFDSVLITVQTIFNVQTRSNLRKSFEHIQITLKNLQSASLSMDEILSSKSTKIQAIIDNAESITQNIENNNEQISIILNNFSQMSDSLAKADIASTLAKTDSAISSFSTIMQKVEAGEGSLGLLVQNDSLYNNLNEAAEDLNNLIQDIELQPDRYLHFSAIRFGKPISKKKKKEK